MEKETVKKEAEILMLDFLERAQEAKRGMCQEESMTDNPPMLIVVFQPDEKDFDSEEAYENLANGCIGLGLTRTLQCALIPLLHKPDPAECLKDIFGSFPLPVFEYAFIATEAFMADSEAVTAAVKNRKEDTDEKDVLAKEFSENPFSSVLETLIVHGYDWNLTNKSTILSPYKYNDNGVPEFMESVIVHTDPNSDSDFADMGDSDSVLLMGIQFTKVKLEAERFTSFWDKKDEGK